MNQCRQILALPLLAMLLSGCTATRPGNVDNICSIFFDKDAWYEDAADASDDWRSPIPVMMAIMHQESRFDAAARPPRRKILGFIPGPRLSDAYGYSQALESTWETYERSVGRFGADRDDFADSIHFIGWYNDQSHRRNGIGREDTYRLYLAYHEGHGGYERGTYRKKQWLMDVARKVERRASTYQGQLQGCEEKLKDGGGWFDWF
jgi:hypothetical protein